MPNFELDQQALNDLGVDRDYNDVPSKSESNDNNDSKDSKGNDDKVFDGAPVQIGATMDFSEKEESKKEKPEKDGKSSEATSENEHSSKKDETIKKDDKSSEEDEKKSSDKKDDEVKASEKDEAASEDDLTFDQRVAKLTAKYDDVDKQSSFLKKLEDEESFQASNTQAAQALSDDRKALEADRQTFNELTEKIGTSRLKEAFEAVNSIDDLDDIQNSLDEWFDGKENNKFRPLLNELRKSFTKIETHVSDTKKIDEERSLLELEKEILAVQSLDDRYKDDANLVSLGKIADEHYVGLVTAHKIYAGETKAKDIETLQKGFDEKESLYKSEIKKLKKELKQRNQDLTEAKAKSPPVIEDTGVIGSGASEFDYAKPSSGFEETRQRLEEQLGA